MEVGTVVEGKITGVMKFGAFVSLPEGKSGLCHISEISNSFVSDINEHVKLGDMVKVKVIAVNPDGKINLSIKKAEPSTEQEKKSTIPAGRTAHTAERHESARSIFRAAPQVADGPSDDADFESRLKRFMQESDSRIANNPRYADRPRKNRRR